MSTNIHILCTMDVEPLKLNPLWTGPEDEESSERYIRSYWDICRSYGFTPSFFVHPEAAGLHNKLFTEYKQAGAALGLHVHSTKFLYPEYRYEFGYYSAAMQKKILLIAKEEWEQALGFSPVYFRPGAFSANDSTAKTLAELGFTGGSLSIPGRIWPERYCVWAGTPPYPHRMHPDFRCAYGEMAFVNIPLSVDFSSPGSSKQYFCYEDLRPSGRKSDPRELLRNIVEKTKADNPAYPIIHMITHNDQPFDDPLHESRQRLEEAVGSVQSVCEEVGYSPISATIEDVVNSILAEPAEQAKSWDQDNDVYF